MPDWRPKYVTINRGDGVSVLKHQIVTNQLLGNISEEHFVILDSQLHGYFDVPTEYDVLAVELPPGILIHALQC